jgi:hypothetical protein
MRSVFGQCSLIQCLGPNLVSDIEQPNLRRQSLQNKLNASSVIPENKQGTHHQMKPVVVGIRI